VTLDIQAPHMAVDRARLDTLRRHLGAQLAAYRAAAVISQPQLGEAIGRTRSTVSKIEHGVRGMPAELWTIADDICGADGALVAEYEALAKAEQDYRDRCRTQRRQEQIQQAGAQAQKQASLAWRARGSSPSVLGGSGGDAWPDKALASAGLAEELMAVVTKLVRLVGRRDAMRLVSGVLASVGLSALDPDEQTRLAHAVASPNRVDAHVVQNLAATLAHCKRLEDTLGPREVLDTLVAQHHLVGRLLSGCPDNLIKPLRLLESNIASTIGIGLINMGQPEEASHYFQIARRAAHKASNPACAAYAAANTSRAAFQRRDTPTALDSAAAARSLAARSGDPRLKAWAEQMAAAAYALDGQYGPCMAACDRAHEFLISSNGLSPESLAYWVHEGALDSQRSLLLCLLGKPHDAVQAALNAQARFDCTYMGGYAHCQIRLGHALVLSKEITEATRVLCNAANYASLSPRLTQELHTTRALIQPWNRTHAVAALDAQLHACGLLLPPHQS
jgi:transcriptional regulator with XRE-family HTH domain